MTLQNFFNSTTVYEARQAAALKKHFELEIKKIPYTPGCAGDYEIVKRSKKYNDLFSNSIIEFKSDKMSRKTKHFYMEFEQTSNGWDTKKNSGHQLAIDKGCLLVIGVFEDFYCFDKTQFDLMINSVEHEQTCTRRRKNFNKDGMGTRAWRVPVKWASEFCNYHFTAPDMSK